MRLTDWDILCREEKGELEEAQRIIQAILTQVRVDDNKKLDSEVLLSGEHWMELGEEVVDPSYFS